MGSFAQDVMTTCISLRFVPKLLEPIFGRLFALPNNYHHRQSAALHRPLIDERLANIRRKDTDPSFNWEEPNDYLTWHIRAAQAEGNERELEPEMISRRLLPINFAAIHTTVFTITNCFFDLLSSPPVNEHGTYMLPLDVIRDEARTMYLSGDGIWSKASLAQMIHSDSAIRESMRVSNFLTRGLQRKVVAKDGIENKREGWKLPFGAIIGVDAHSIMHDAQIYPNPDSFDAFRFARAREEEEEEATSTMNRDAQSNGQPGQAKTLGSKQLAISSTSSTFLPFGHGRHACPGRFLVSHELKMLLAYATMFYEIEALPVRPPNTWFGQHVVPPMKATIRVRRRKPEEVML
jgi:cytochrome P450